MAGMGLPALADKSSPPTPRERFEDGIAELVAQGKRPDEIARKAYPKDLKKRKSLRTRIWYLVRYDAHFANRVAARARGEMVLAIGPAARALGARAGRGRPDAIKLLYEASGFHNPRVKHEHSGEITVKVSAPRPKFDEPVVDADVVED